MSGDGPLARLGAATGRHPWITLAVWTVLLGAAVGTALLGVTGETLFGRLLSAAPTANGESTRADDVLSGDEVERESFTLLVHEVDPADPEAAAIAAVLAERVGDVARSSVVAPFGLPPEVAGPLLAEDGDGFLITVTVEGEGTTRPDPGAVDEALAAIRSAAEDYRDAFPGATVEVGGTSLLVDSIVEISENDLRRGETVALPIALLVMLVVFGGFLAAGVPLLGAGAAIGGGLGILFGLTHVTDIDTTVVNVVTAVGLGLSIDYGLLMVSRFREEYRRLAADGTARRDRRIVAIRRTAATAGRTVVYSGTTFGIAALGLLVFEPRMVRAVGLGALAVTVIAIASAVTLVPALLSLGGERLVRPGLLTRIPGVGRALSRWGDVAPAEGFFSRLTRLVQRRPALVTVACTLVLILVGSPLATLRLANTSIDAIPSSASQHGFVTVLTEHFPDAAGPRIALVTDSEATGIEWGARVADLAHAEDVGPTRPTGDAWMTRVRVDPENGVDLVREIRAARDDLEGWVTGTDARTVDLSDSLIRGAPWAVAILALGTIVLLFLMTGSLVIPLKALLASALSLGASIGVLVWGFEQGNFAGIMGFDAEVVHGVDVLVLLLTFVFGFGLAMDYEMFILSRIKEQVDRGVPDSEAIALGLQRSGRIITSAALIIIVVFAGFATGDLMVIKQLGTALAVAVLLDATLVRCLLVPAFMTWQRRILWWAPRPLKRLHARFALRD
jgi:RND superfamily putative drug exporter